MQDALNDLSKRYPEGFKSQVFYDSSTFVTDTIAEVKSTLIEAFVLVVIVVFLFLGNIRATIIPTIAVPVSLVGTFAVLLALGYSANTVSLLALVLAIGIVVDDAIVVVENVERVLEEEPDLTPKEATKKAMAQITAPIIAITLVLLSVFVPIGFIPGISGTLFRQFAVTISVAMLISATNALTLSPALCGVFLRHEGPRRGIMGRIGRGIDWVRDGYAGIVARLLRVGVIAIPASAGLRRRHLRFGPAHADRVPAGRGPGRILHRGAVARRRQRDPHPRRGGTGGGCGEIHPANPERAIDRRLLAAGCGQPVELGVHRGATETVCRPEGREGQGADADRPGVRRRAANSVGDDLPVQPAADYRPIDRWRL